MKLQQHGRVLIYFKGGYLNIFSAQFYYRSNRKIIGKGFFNKAKFLFILVLVLARITIFSQDRILVNQWRDSFSLAKNDTSTVNALRKLGKLYDGIIPDSAIYFTRRALSLAEKIKWTKGIAQNCLNMGAYFENTSMYDSALFYDNRALEFAKIVGDKDRIALIYNNRSNVYTETEQYEKAITDIKQTLLLSEQTGSKDRQTRAYQSMCELYMYQENYEAAMTWGQKALQLSKELGNEEFQSVAEMSIGGMYSLKNDFIKAENYLLDGIQKANKTNRPDIVIECYLGLSDDYIQTHRYNKAIDVLNKGVMIAEKVHLIDPLSALYQNLGNAYYASKKYQEGLDAHQKGYEITKGKIEFQKLQYGNLEGIAQSYAALHNYKNAYESALLASEIKDSALKKQRDKKLLSLQTQFETTIKEKQIELLKKDQLLTNVSLQRHKTFRNAAYIIVGLLILIGYIIINRYRTVQRSKRLTELEQMRNNIARNLHDDIGSTLTSINILSKVALQQTSQSNGFTSNLKKIKERSADIMERMNDIVWSINPSNDELDKVIVRMKEFGNELCEQSGIQCNFMEEGDVTNTSLSLKQRSDLYLIFKEALNNAVKYSEAKIIEVTIQRKAGHLLLKISDDGKGFNTIHQFKGNGLKNMVSRAGEIHAILKTDSIIGTGTNITLDIPIT